MTSINIDVKQEYLELIGNFLRNEMGANEFSLTYLNKMKNDNRTFGDDLYELLEEMFGEANSYTDNQEIYDSNPDFYLTGDGLKIKAKEIFNKLNEMSSS